MKARLLLVLALAGLFSGCTTNLDPEEREFFYGSWRRPNERFESPEQSIDRVP